MFYNGLNDYIMRATIITIGQEILIGQIIDSNAAFIGEKLTQAGIDVVKILSIPDHQTDICSALEYAGKASDVVIITGGLGPTSDDVTKPAICDYFNTRLVHHEPTLQHVIKLLAARGFAMNEKNRSQAMVPEKATVVSNRLGTAPGLWLEKDRIIYVFMPGVPFEMKTILTGEVIPELGRRYTLQSILQKNVLTQGIPESYVAERLAEFEKQLPKAFELAYLPSPGMVRLRLTIKGSSKKETEPLLQQQVGKMVKIVEPWVYGYDEETLPSALGKILKKVHKTLATAESCTGGGIASAITSVPGSSEYFLGTVVAYSNALKQQLLKVPEHIIQEYGAVSEQVVRAMAEGVLHLTGSDYAIAVTGIAGPDGGTPEKPVGTVWIAVGDKHTIIPCKFLFGEYRDRNVFRSVQTSLNMLRMFLSGIDIQAAFRV